MFKLKGKSFLCSSINRALGEERTARMEVKGGVLIRELSSAQSVRHQRKDSAVVRRRLPGRRPVLCPQQADGEQDHVSCCSAAPMRRRGTLEWWAEQAEGSWGRVLTLPQTSSEPPSPGAPSRRGGLTRSLVSFHRVLGHFCSKNVVKSLSFWSPTPE